MGDAVAARFQGDHGADGEVEPRTVVVPFIAPGPDVSKIRGGVLWDDFVAPFSPAEPSSVVVNTRFDRAPSSCSRINWIISTTLSKRCGACTMT